MPISEAARSDLYTGLSEVIGPERAETLMNAIPLHDLDEVATRGDIAVVKEDIALIKADIVEMRAGMTEMRSGMTEMRSGMTEMRTELKSDIAILRAEVKADMATQIGALRKLVSSWMVTLWWRSSPPWPVSASHCEPRRRGAEPPRITTWATGADLEKGQARTKSYGGRTSRAREERRPLTNEADLSVE